MLKDLWSRIMGREHETAVEHEAEREKMSTDERRFDSESIDDIQADASAQEHLGGFNPERLEEDDAPRT